MPNSHRLCVFCARHLGHKNLGTVIIRLSINIVSAACLFAKVLCENDVIMPHLIKVHFVKSNITETKNLAYAQTGMCYKLNLKCCHDNDMSLCICEFWNFLGMYLENIRGLNSKVVFVITSVSRTWIFL